MRRGEGAGGWGVGRQARLQKWTDSGAVTKAVRLFTLSLGFCGFFSSPLFFSILQL